MSYEQKYLKYKSKYLALKRELEGAGIFDNAKIALSRAKSAIKSTASATLKSVKGSLGVSITKGSDIKYVDEKGISASGTVVAENKDGTFNILVRANKDDWEPTIPINNVPRSQLENRNTITALMSKERSPNRQVKKALLSSETV